MDLVLLSRLQFALTVGFHFIFPPISIGLAWMLVVAEGIGWRRNSEAYRELGRFFAKVLGLTFAMGVATGIVMEFQFGTNWAGYSRYVGDIFGAPLAAEAVFAFFLESGFLGLYLFGRKRLSPGAHWFSILMVALGATLSAFWILVANSWQQTPAGFRVNEVLGRAELTSFSEAVFNPSTGVRFWHTTVAALVTGAFFMAGFSAILLLRRRDNLMAQAGLKLGLAAGLAGALLSAFPTGHEHALQVARTQPEKFATIEGLYEGRNNAPLVVFGVPDASVPRLNAAIELPGMLSMMVHGDPDAYVPGLSDFPADGVPKGAELWLSFLSFHNMVALGGYFVLLSALGLYLLWRRKLFGGRAYLRLFAVTFWLPIAACQLGWITAEVGRQPWIVYKLLRTRDAVSAVVPAEQVLASMILFGLVYLGLGLLWVFLLSRKLKSAPVLLPGGKEVA